MIQEQAFLILKQAPVPPTQNALKMDIQDMEMLFWVIRLI